MAVSTIQRCIDTSTDTIIGGLRYVKGFFKLTVYDNMLHRIQNFIDVLLEDSDALCYFDVVINGAGQFRFSGYVYSGKQYGAGMVYGYGGYATYWYRNNGTDTLKNVSLTNL